MKSLGGFGQDGKQLPDGEYQFVITYRPTASGAKQQELNFKVKIDNTAPSIESGSAHTIQQHGFSDQVRYLKP